MNKTNQQELIGEKEIQDLITAEQKVNALLKEFQNTKKRLCLFLAQIKIRKLYEQINMQSFKEYVMSNRLKISYNTALEYAKIGELLLNYENELAKVDFSEEDGFKKLLFLEQALSIHEPDEVFKRIKEDSFKAFSKFSKPARAGFTPERLKKIAGDGESKEQSSQTGQWIFEENGNLYMDTNARGTELLTFNRRFLEDESLAEEYKLFMTNIIVVTMDYFKDIRKKRGQY